MAEHRGEDGVFSQFDFTTIIEMNIIFILARYMFLGFIVMRLRKMYPVESRPADMYVIGGGKVGVRRATRRRW